MSYHQARITAVDIKEIVSLYSKIARRFKKIAEELPRLYRSFTADS